MGRKRIVVKNHLEEIRLINRRVILALGLVAFLVVILISRLFYLQVIKQELYTTLSKKNWMDLIPSEPTRGLIYDRNGILLAENIPVFSLDAIPYKIQDMPQTLADISKIIPLTETDIAQFQKELKNHRRFEEVPLKFRLTEKELAVFSENQYRFSGLVIKARLMRFYPYGKSLAHTLGYVARINTEELTEVDAVNYSASNYIGKSGIEKYYEEELHGKVGYQQVESDAGGQTSHVLNQINPVPGENLYLTIDLNLQMAAEQALEGHRGAVVAIQPDTGQILAMVSEPSFDPNLFVAGISNTDYQALQQSSNRPLYNRAIRGLYPLASTIKPYIALQGLNTGMVDPEETLYDPGWFKLNTSKHLFHDDKHEGHGNVNLARAITVSCDTYFYDLAFRMGINRIDDMLKQFGFGQNTGVDIHDELPGVVASPSWKRDTKGIPWYLGDTVISGIGQGYMQATPLQLASAVSAIANHGMHYAPYLLFAEQEINKPSVPQEPVPLNPVHLSNPKFWNIVISAMENVIASPEGTAHFKFGGGYHYTIAGKTGTAQVYSKIDPRNDHDHEQTYLPEKLRDHSLFVAFAPTDHPKIAIAIVVENSKLAVTVARKILDFYITGKPVQTAEGTEPA